MTILLKLAMLASLAQAPDPGALAIVDTAIARMGGSAALRGVQRVRYEFMTQWQRTTFDARPYADYPSYERHTDLRDYTVSAWRNTRNFIGPGAPRYITDVVADSIAIRDIGSGTGFAPLNVAYVDERRELFAISPERLVLLARDANDLRMLADTLIGGMPHARVSATIDRFPAVLFFRRSDGLPAMMRFHAGAPNDFGLAPWGEMDVEVWYSNWRTLPGPISIPTQWDVSRVGRPYKRLTVLGATFNPAATPDSFVVSDSLRDAYLRGFRKPMHDLPYDSARVVEQRFAQFGAFGSPVGAVKLGSQWMLLEAGQSNLSAQRALATLGRLDPGARVAGAIVSSPFAGSGGVVHLVQQRLPIHVGAQSGSVVQAILRNHDTPTTQVRNVGTGAWHRVDGDSIWIGAIDLPNARGAVIAYVPSLSWVYSAPAAQPIDLEAVRAFAQRRGWNVTRHGSSRGINLPIPPR